MNVFLFMYMEYRSVTRDECAGYDGNVVFGGLLCPFFFVVVLFFVCSYFYFFTEPFTS